MISRRCTCSLAAAVLLLVLGAESVGAQANACPVVSDAVVAQALGSAVVGSSEPGMPAGFDACAFRDASGTSYGVTRQAATFGPGAGAADLALMAIPNLPPEARTQIDALSQAGLNVAVPGYQLSAVSGVGDAAIWVKSELVPGIFKDSLLVMQGSDGYAFDVDDGPDAQAKLAALAQAVIGAAGTAS